MRFLKNKNLRLVFSICALAGAVSPCAADAGTAATIAFGGHAKYDFLLQSWPSNSIFRDVLGASSSSNYLEARLKSAATRGRWNFALDYQLIAVHSDTLQLSDQLPGTALPVGGVIDDGSRWWDLTWRNGDGDHTAFVHRIDRLSVAYTTDRTVWRFGRQAISWGNGLLFTPMDVFNPFDPAAVDKEYKTGDDMLYGQYLLDSGGDIQGVAIVRRDPRSGEVEADQGSLAIKYHGFLDMNELDVLAAQHYDDQILGLGGNVNLGGAVWRGDLTWTRTGQDDIFSAVSSLSYSWTWGGKNVSGLLEYYYNGFGQRAGDYAPSEIARNPDLLVRLGRGELFTLGRHYLAASATIEMTPLFLLTPNLFLNLGDPSALAQVVAQIDVRQDFMVLCAVNIPIGPEGSEYGGIEAPAENRYFSTGPSLFAQVAWYF